MMLQFSQLAIPATGTGSTSPAYYPLVAQGRPTSLHEFPRSVVVFTEGTSAAPVVFYEVRSESSYRILRRFIDQHPTWEVSTEWTRGRFHWYLRERLSQALPTFHFRETRQGWVRVTEPRQAQVTTSQEEALFIPQIS